LGAKKTEIESSNRAYLILSCIASAQDPRELNVSEISRQTKTPLTTTQNLCQKLHNEDYLSIIESPISKHYTIHYSKLVEMFFDFIIREVKFVQEYLHYEPTFELQTTYNEIRSNHELNLFVYAQIKLTFRQSFIEFRETHANSTNLNALFKIIMSRKIYLVLFEKLVFEENDYGDHVLAVFDDFEKILNYLLIDQDFIEDILDIYLKSNGNMI